MGTQNGTIDGVTLLSGSLEGDTNTVSTTIYTRKSYLITASFPAYVGSTDTATITGICTAIAAATRNGRALTLRFVAPVGPGKDTSSPPITAFFTGAANVAPTLSNTTTTGDAAAQLGDAAGTEIGTATGAVNGVTIVAIVDEN